MSLTSLEPPTPSRLHASFAFPKTGPANTDIHSLSTLPSSQELEHLNADLRSVTLDERKCSDARRMGRHTVKPERKHRKEDFGVNFNEQYIYIYIYIHIS